MRDEEGNTHEAGLTLVEILASLVILGIVFVAFMTIFPQMTLFNNRTETKLETMNEARVVLEEYRAKSLSKSSLFNDTCSASKWHQLEYDGNHEFDDNRSVLIRVKDCPDVKPTNATLANTVQLHQIHIEVKDRQQLISETFGFVKVK